MKLPDTRRVTQIGSHGHIRVAEQAMPALGKGEVLIRAACSLISPGTELQSLRSPGTEGEEIWTNFGYQSAGLVIAIGEDCENLQIGQRVACMGHQYALHSDFVIVPQNLVVPIGPEISFEEGAFANLANTAVHALRRAEPSFGEHFAVIGLGAVGQLICQVAALSGIHVVAIDGVEMRRQRARELGAEISLDLSDSDSIPAIVEWTRGYGLDAAFIAFGGDASNVIRDIATMMKRAPDTHQYGRVVIVGGATINLALPVPLGNMDIRSSSRTGPGYHDKAWERGRDYPEALVPWNTRRNLNEVFRFVELGKLHLKPLITDRVSPCQIADACNRLIWAPQESLGVIVQWDPTM
jgi:threonine dehydrogenase-like Zn-dependent dehydrogenase